MKEALKKAITATAKKSEGHITGMEAQQYSQAALNLAKALEVVTEVEIK